MSGLFALLDDVGAIAQVAASSLDDVAAQATKAGTKAAALVIDDAAVTPQYAQGFSASRELPIVWRIAKGSIRNKLLILLPVGLLLSAFLPWVITPLLMMGGGYLAFEGAEKILHKLTHKTDAAASDKPEEPSDPAHLEEEKVAGAIKTDFILSAEIMTVSLATVSDAGFWSQTVTLILVAFGITALVYGGVAVIVKADDVGLFMARRARLAVMRRLGCWIVRSMPAFLKGLTVVGTAAMLWVGGSILLHGAEVLGFGLPAHLVEAAAEGLAHLTGPAEGVVHWLVTAFLDALAGLGVGLLLVPLAERVFTPLWAKVPKFRT